MERPATDKIIGAIVLVIGLVAAVLSMRVGTQMWGGESARLFPFSVSLVLILLGALLLWRGKDSFTLGEEAGKVLLLALCGFGYVWLITKLGYLIATGLTAPLVFRIFGVTSPVGLAITAIACPIVFHLIFFVGLGVFPPYGEWFDFLYILTRQ